MTIKKNIKRKAIQRFISKDFAKELDKIKEMRIKVGTDTIQNIKADWRITLAMLRHPKFIILEEDIINSKLD